MPNNARAEHWQIRIWRFDGRMRTQFFVRAFGSVTGATIPHPEPYSHNSLGSARKEARRMSVLLNRPGEIMPHNRDTAEIVEAPPE